MIQSVSKKQSCRFAGFISRLSRLQSARQANVRLYCETELRDQVIDNSDKSRLAKDSSLIPSESDGNATPPVQSGRMIPIRAYTEDRRFELKIVLRIVFGEKQA
jgi:hypothetical protein